MFNENSIQIFTKKLEDLKIKKNEQWAIYGTGNGAEYIYTVLKAMKEQSSFKYVIERDDKVEVEAQFHELPIVKLNEVCESLDGIIIAAINNHEIIKKRIMNSLTNIQLKKIRVIDIFVYNTADEKIEYVDYIEKNILRNSEEFISYSDNSYCRCEEDAKAIAWYLPQFHQMDINNKFHGQGFTEWTNTTRALPVFTGHYQPHIPYDVGYYDLLNLDTFKRQIFLAKHYGIYGFCLHYYWFSGTRIMEKPLDLLLEHKELDIPFCLNWATENWTALWDGGSQEVMLEQKLKDGDDEKFMEDILPYMKDSRYIKIKGKPVLIIYRINMFEKDRANILLNNFRRIAKENGFPDLYIMLTNAFAFTDDVVEWGADALVEFPPHGITQLMEEYRPYGYVNPHYKGTITDATSFISEKRYMLKHNSKEYYRSVLLSWDNSARKATSNGRIITGLSPSTFKIWLKDILRESQHIHSESENIVFVNSWNEWAEGSHLEPDMKYGYAYLQALKDGIEESRGTSV